MKGRFDPARAGLAMLDAGVAATAIGGGIALAAGLEAQRFPPEWLEGTPFRDYVAPGALLATAVGGSAALATVATIRNARAGGVASVLAGSVMVGWILGEVAVLRDGGPRVSRTEAAYLTAGLAMAGIGLLLARR